MNDSLREYLSYFGIGLKILRVKKTVKPVKVSFGPDPAQYFLYFEPEKVKSDKIIVWIHGGGWNSGSPKSFDYVGECVAKQGYRFISLGYRLSPRYKYPCQIADVCRGFNLAVGFLRARKIDTSRIIVAGPSAGAHLASLLCYSRKVQEKYHVDVSNIIGFIGTGGPYSFRKDSKPEVRMLLNQLFRKGYDRRKGEPVKLMSPSSIPMLLIQSRHDGLIEYACAEDFQKKARKVGNACELYTLNDLKSTHTRYTAGMFLETREENRGLDRFFSWIEEREETCNQSIKCVFQNRPQ